jgi:excisionase family DNA binding protein
MAPAAAIRNRLLREEMRFNKGERAVVEPTEKLTSETWTVPQAGEILGLNRNAAYKAAIEGRIPTIRMGPRLLRVPKSALQRLLTGTTD